LTPIKVEIHSRDYLLVFPVILPSVGLLISPLGNRTISSNVLTMSPPSWHVAVLVGAALVMMVMDLCLGFYL
jgi:hypothetical protein